MSLRFFAGGGAPPQSHEVLLAHPDGDGWYLTGMPWPEQPPFDEIGTYRSALGPAVYRRLAQLARAAIAEPAPERRYADAGGESVELDGASASWGPRNRSPAAGFLLEAVRTAISAARQHPFAVARAEFAGDDLLSLTNRGEAPLRIASGEVRAGWGPVDHAPSPLRLAYADPVAMNLPSELAPGSSITLPRPNAGPISDLEFATPYALVHLGWRPEIAGEPDVLDGWIIAGPG